MSLLKPERALSLAVLLIAGPAICLGAAIQVNGTCEIGTCASPGTLTPGMSISTTPFTILYTFANTDKYSITGSYSASGTEPIISFSAVASYIGNATSTASSTDVLSVDLLEMFGYSGPTSGTYTETATLSQGNVAAGSSVTAQLFFGGVGIGLLGPYSGSSPQTFNGSKVLTPSNPALADFNYTFNLAAGSPVTTPEPATDGFLALGLSVIATAHFRRVRAKRTTNAVS